MHQNVTLRDSLIGYSHFIRNKSPIAPLLKYRKKFSNWIEVIGMYKRGKYPIFAHLRNGNKIPVENQSQLFSILMDLDYDPKSDIINLVFNDCKLKILAGIKNGDLVGIFQDNCYRFLPARDKIIIDIGANIADSALYFACRRALKVIALEPSAKNFAIAKKNIELNNFGDTVELVLAGCSGNKGRTAVNGDHNNVFMSLEMAKSGCDVRLTTLEEILSSYRIDSGILKMDCEGSEYPIILETSKETLERFTHVQIEYHYGYHNLYQKLVDCGFQVSVSSPTFFHNKFVTDRNMYVGWIYATQKT